MELYISPTGNDAWSGRRPAPNRAKNDGPLATPARALALLRGMKNRGELRGPLTIRMRGGVYPLQEPIRITPEDSWPVTFAAYKNERPILDGGQRITGWRLAKLRGRTAWVVDLPDVANGKRRFRELFVNNRRAPRPRLPIPDKADSPFSLDSTFRIAHVPGLNLPCGWTKNTGNLATFICDRNHPRNFHNLTDIETVFLHFWIEERSTITALDPATGALTVARPSYAALSASHGSDPADYYLDNVYEALCLPGQWYLDCPKGRLTYLPRPGEHPDRTEVWAPRLLQLVILAGEPDAGRFVEHVRFRGLTFRNTDWRHPGEETNNIDPETGDEFARGRAAAAPQAASDVPGVIRFLGARHCALQACVIEHTGWYAVEIGAGCRAIQAVGNIMRDLGAGGVKINGASAADQSPARQTGHHVVTDNTITMAGRVFHSAVGILAMHAHDLTLSHNHINDLYYTGISCGWEWGYQENAAFNNLIEANHIHNLGQGLLSDMGGIYVLGVQPGTIIRGNWIHDVRSAHYGGWCLYTDEGASHILIEKNLCHHADCNIFHQHYGRENILRNNVFAFGGASIAAYSRKEPHCGFTFERNVLVTDGKPVWTSNFTPHDDAPRFLCDTNLIWDISGAQPFFGFKASRKLSIKAWRKLGRDRHSIIADPLFKNLGLSSFALAKSSPAYKLGFQRIDFSCVGPRRAQSQQVTQPRGEQPWR